MAYPDLASRQTTSDNYDGFDDGDWYYSDTAEIVKYVIVASILALLLLWVLGGAWHARRRIRNGQQPLYYHRWLAPRQHRASAVIYHNYPYSGYGPQPGQQYPMQDWNYANAPAPPPQYGHDAPPQYQSPPYPLPPGASKANPDQRVSVTEANAPNESGAGSSVQRPAPTQAENPFRD